MKKKTVEIQLLNMSEISFYTNIEEQERFKFAAVIKTDALSIKNVNFKRITDLNHVLFCKKILETKNKILKVGLFRKRLSDNSIIFMESYEQNVQCSMNFKVFSIDSDNQAICSTKLCTKDSIPIQVHKFFIINETSAGANGYFMAEREYNEVNCFDPVTGCILKENVLSHIWTKANCYVDSCGNINFLRNVFAGEKVVIACFGNFVFHDDFLATKLLMGCLSFLHLAEEKIAALSGKIVVISDLSTSENQINSGCSFESLIWPCMINFGQQNIVEREKLLQMAVMTVGNFFPDECYTFMNDYPNGHFSTNVHQLNHFFFKSFREMFNFNRVTTGQLANFQHIDKYIAYIVECRQSNDFYIAPYNPRIHFEQKLHFGFDYEYLNPLSSYRRQKMKRKRVRFIDMPLNSLHLDQKVSRIVPLCIAVDGIHSDEVIRLMKENAKFSVLQCCYQISQQFENDERCLQKGSDVRVCESCWLVGKVSVNMSYCPAHMNHDTNFNKHYNMKGASNQTVHEVDLVYSSWSHLFNNSPALCIETGIRTPGHDGKFSIEEACELLTYTSEAKNNAVSFDIISENIPKGSTFRACIKGWLAKGESNKRSGCKAAFESL